MTSISLTVRRRTVVASLLMLCLASAAGFAQRRGPEFTRQLILVSNFGVVDSSGAPALGKSDMRLGRRLADAVRDRLSGLVDKREARVIGGFAMRESLAKSGIWPDTVLSLADLHRQGQMLRADEMVTGTVTRTPAGIRVDATFLLWRDMRERQPIAPVVSPTVDRLADTLAARLAAARVQLAYVRRCENSLRDGAALVAMQSARDGMAAYPAGSLARTCLLGAMRATGAPPAQVLEQALAILAVDSAAPHALEAAAMSYDSLQRRDDAAGMWLRLAATDSNNTEFVERVVWSMAESGNSARAEPLIIHTSRRFPDNLRLLRQKWRITNDTRNWDVAIRSGERLLAVDSEAVGNPLFFLRLASAYRATGEVYKGVETIARGVAAFPEDARLYALYAQFVKEESDVVIDRGIGMFPGSAELLALNAKELRAQGKMAEALDASKRAVALDSTITQGLLFVAQAEMDLGRPDSAFATLHRAVAAGEDRGALAQFALSKGNMLFRAANGTKTRADFQLAMRFLAFADSLRSTPQSKFLLGAAALNVAQTALNDAPKVAAKEESCTISQLGAESIPIARASLEAGQDVSPEATRQFLQYLDQIGPYADRQLAVFCGTASAPKKGGR